MSENNELLPTEDQAAAFAQALMPQKGGRRSESFVISLTASGLTSSA